MARNHGESTSGISKAKKGVKAQMGMIEKGNDRERRRNGGIGKRDSIRLYFNTPP
jgi:hypothetical protein